MRIRSLKPPNWWLSLSFVPYTAMKFHKRIAVPTLNNHCIRRFVINSTTIVTALRRLRRAVSHKKIPVVVKLRKNFLLKDTVVKISTERVTLPETRSSPSLVLHLKTAYFIGLALVSLLKSLFVEWVPHYWAAIYDVCFHSSFFDI